MKFVLYGRYDSKVCVAAHGAATVEGCDFDYLELDCDQVLIAFRGGREIDRTYDMSGVDRWVKNLVLGVGGCGEAAS